MASARYSKIRLQTDGAVYILFNDSGLNTKAEANINQVPIRYSNYFKIDGCIFSAYYAKTDSVRITAVNRTTNTTLFSNVTVATDVPAKSQIDSAIWIITTGVQAAQGDIIDLTITATNAEGDLSNTFTGIECQGMLDDVVFWQLLSSQGQDPSTGTQYVVVPTVEQWNYIQRFLEEHPTPSNWNATNEHEGLMAALHGAQGNDFTESALTTQLPAGHYYVISGLDRAVILFVDSNGEVFGWCNSSYSPPTPVNPLNNISVAITATYTIDNNTSSVVITDMIVELTNSDNSSMSVSVSAVMIDGATNINVGSTTIAVPAGETEQDTLLDSEKDDAIRYTSLSGTPIVQITLSYGQFTKTEEIELT